MSDTRWWTARLAAEAARDAAAEDVLRRLAVALEEMATSDEPHLPDLMDAGFVEALDPSAAGSRAH